MPSGNLAGKLYTLEYSLSQSEVFFPRKTLMVHLPPDEEGKTVLNTTDKLIQTRKATLFLPSVKPLRSLDGKIAVRGAGSVGQIIFEFSMGHFVSHFYMSKIKSAKIYCHYCRRTTVPLPSWSSVYVI